MARYKGDPYWTTARFSSRCKCGQPVTKGEQIFYYPNGKTVCGSRCGCAEAASADFDAHAFDEAFYNGGY